VLASTSFTAGVTRPRASNIDAMSPGPIRLAGCDAPRVTDVFCDAFRDYPVMRYVLGADAGDERRLRRLIGFFVLARALRGDPLIGVRDGGELVAAVAVSYPGRASQPTELGYVRELVWQELGSEARARYDECGAVWAPLGVDVPHIHVNMIGVRRSHQKRGLARHLLDDVAELSRTTEDSRGISLTTEEPGNVAFYEHLGFEVSGCARIGPGTAAFDTWALFRAT
jgi:GNAT superfamily N-acetyltransferase